MTAIGLTKGDTRICSYKDQLGQIYMGMIRAVDGD